LASLASSRRDLYMHDHHDDYHDWRHTRDHDHGWHDEH
jgi:hypothetical protein